MNNHTVSLIPIFTDNYVFVIENHETNEAVVVDPGSSSEVSAYLNNKNLKLAAIFLTHHHDDHIGGVEELVAYAESKQNKKIKIYAPLFNNVEIPFATDYLQEPASVSALGLEWQVMELPGHTLGHIGYYCREAAWLFSGDVLFGLGCGRLFEGSPAQQYRSLQKIKSLSENTKVFCTHEYTERNLAFCKDVLVPLNLQNGLNASELSSYESQLVAVRAKQHPSVPLDLAKELKNNPFLLAKNVDEFADIRSRRNKF